MGGGEVGSGDNYLCEGLWGDLGPGKGSRADSGCFSGQAVPGGPIDGSET